MPSSSISDLTPDTRAAIEQLLDYASRQGIGVVVTHTLRSCAEQDALYAQGRTASGERVTNASGCRSWHTHGRAADILIKEADGSIVHNGHDPRYAQLGRKAKELGFRWGGDFGDFGHFEYHPGLTISGVCPDPTDCSHLGQPKLAEKKQASEPSQSTVIVAWAIIGAFGYWWLDKQYRITDRVAAQIGGAG